MNGSPQGSQTVPAQKLSSRLNSFPQRHLEQSALLVMSGSFNPVHTQHTRAMEVARLALERAGWTIVGGVLAPSDDSYVQTKTNKHALSFQRRIELCRLATEHADWLFVSSVGDFRTYRVCTTIREQVQQEFAEALQGRTIMGVEVMGSDTAIRLMRQLVEE